MKNKTAIIAAVGLSVLLAVIAWRQWWARDPHAWSEAETAQLRSLWIAALPPLPADPSNAVADDPYAAAFGHRLFFDPRLSGNGAISCSTCHQPERRFTDGLPKGRAIGESPRNTMSIIGAAYSPWQYWDGRKDSLWSQSLSPLEDTEEHGGSRLRIARLIAGDADYRPRYESLFGPLPDFDDSQRFPDDAAPVDDPERRRAWENMAEQDRHVVNRLFSNVGKAIAAYERLLLPGPARFDRYVGAVVAGEQQALEEIYTRDEAAGLRLFIGEARCTECHNGPLLTNNEFHNTGLLPPPGDLPDRGRIDGVREVRADPFNCTGAYSDDPMRHCPELRFARDGIELLGAFRTPSLRNLEGTAPFMHGGQFRTLEEAIEHYNRAPPAVIGHNEAKPLSLSRRERAQLAAFLRTLSAPPATPEAWLSAPRD